MDAPGYTSDPPLDGTRSGQIVPLHLLRSNECGSIVDVSGDDGVITRLEEMGFRSGADVRMLRPGSPCIVAVNDHRMSFRCEPTTQVLVEID